MNTHAQQLTEAAEKHHKALVGLAAKILDNPVDAEDVVQGVYLAVLGRPAPELETATFPTYLFGAVRKAALAHRRNRRRRAELDLLLPPEPTVDPERMILLRERIEQCLRRLTPRQFIVFTAVRFWGYTQREVARALGRAQSSVRDVLARADERVAQCDQH